MYKFFKKKFSAGLLRHRRDIHDPPKSTPRKSQSNHQRVRNKLIKEQSKKRKKPCTENSIEKKATKSDKQAEKTTNGQTIKTEPEADEMAPPPPPKKQRGRPRKVPPENGKPLVKKNSNRGCKWSFSKI